MSDEFTTADLIRQLQNQVIDSSVPLSDTMRMAKVLAATLKDERFREWVDSELNGYGQGDELPSYRRLRAESLGTFANAFRMIKNVSIPVSTLPKNIRKHVMHLPFVQNVRELEDLTGPNSADGTLESPWTPELVILASKHFKRHDGAVLVDARMQFAPNEVIGILEQVRNRLLDILLGLQDFELQDPAPGSNGGKASATKVTNVITNVFGDGNTVAAGHELKQISTQKVSKGNTESLLAVCV